MEFMTCMMYDMNWGAALPGWLENRLGHNVAGSIYRVNGSQLEQGTKPITAIWAPWLGHVYSLLHPSVGKCVLFGTLMIRITAWVAEWVAFGSG